MQQAQQPALATRPEPLTARQAVAGNQRNAQSERAVRQLLRHADDEARLPTLPYAAYRPGAPGRDPWQETKDDFGQTWYATQVEYTRVYAH